MASDKLDFHTVSCVQADHSTTRTEDNMEMETLPDTAWPPGSKCEKNFTGSSLSSSTHNGHSDDEEIVDIDDVSTFPYFPILNGE